MEVKMAENYSAALAEIRDMIKILTEKQDLLVQEINQLKEDQRKLMEEVRISNFVLNNITMRSEILN